ncbi:SMI1/KNR4 family protein [Paenibacillus albus]|uniref:Knr4/Smi1-like domain-containing protein n=1 Tax=Paenibacillus albus TaxID=2495582 RepID=A0A3S9A2L3_9BACL|nr:SMI1/KNR4 family protein [Paenibacillus albus]AZN39922.1 hypothetical protein EJC50_09875 [Paenibacillus albus]
MSKRAKEVLISNRLTSPHDKFEPIQIVDELPEGALQLDGSEPPPDFYYGSRRDIGDLSFSEIKAIHLREKEVYNQTEKPKQLITIKHALTLLNREKKKRPEDFCKRLSHKELSTAVIKLPVNWLELLKITNGGYLSLSCSIVPFQTIMSFSADKLKEGQELDELYPDNRISVAERGDGDWYDLVLNDDTIEDCPVVQVTHEGGEIIREWKGIAFFIYDMILEDDNSY